MIMTFTDDHASKSTHALGNNVYHSPDPFTSLFGQLIAIVTRHDSFLYLCLWRCSWNPQLFLLIWTLCFTQNGGLNGDFFLP